ncbi:MAG: histidine kinase [Bacteroidia bacterium]|nr:histidine kinase [Bacteroidia bacterium]
MYPPLKNFFQLLIWTAILLISCPMTYSQIRSNSRFSPLMAQDGLTGNRTRAILQDDMGEIWIGTQNGLNRYDGQDVIRYQYDPANPYSLADNFIHTIVQDTHGQLWIGTARAGICRFDPSTNQFHPLYDLEGNKVLDKTVVKSICIASDTLIWIGTHRGLFQCHLTAKRQLKKMKVFRHESDNPNSIARGMIMDIVQTDPHTLWIGTYHDGLDRISFGQDTVIDHFYKGKTSSSTFQHDYLHDLQIDAKGNLWIGTAYGAYYIKKHDLNHKEDRIQQISPLEFGPEVPHEASVNAFKLSPSGELWMATDHGLYQYLYQNESLEFRDLIEVWDHSKGANAIYTFTIDHTGRFWLASMEGVFYENGQQDAFQQFKWKEADQLVRAVVEDQYGYLWVGTETEGVHVLDKDGKAIFQLSQENGKLKGNFVTEILIDKEEKVWVGQFRAGASRLTILRNSDGQPISSQASHFEGSALGNPDIEDIFQDDQGRIWMASLAGLIRKEVIQDKFHFYRARWGNEVTQTSDGRIWMASSAGLYIYDEKADSIRPYDYSPNPRINLSRQIILSLWPSQDSALWAGTPHALYRIKEGGEIILFQETNGLAGNLIHQIQGDKKGKLWLATQKGISCLDLNSLNIESFFPEDGLPMIQFSDRANAIRKSGEVLMGGGEGLIQLQADKLQSPSEVPNVILTDIELFNQSIPIFWQAQEGNQRYLSQSPRHLKKLKFAYKEKSFTIKFKAITFGKRHRIKYRYRMVDFDNTWNQVSSVQGQATYTNLSPGNYKFQVQASLDGKNWTEKARDLEISISPPWYQSLWAYFLYCILILSLIGGAFYLRLRQIRKTYQTQVTIALARAEERENVRRRSARDFHDEAGNRLTKLSLYTELTKRLLGKNQDASRYLENIEKNLAGLSSGMRDFIWVLNPEHDALQETLNRIAEFGNQLFVDSPIQFKTAIDHEAFEYKKLDIPTKRHLILIFKEAMNNCLKYSQATESRFSAYLEKDKVKVAFQDNGKGFAIEQAIKGNGLKNMRARAAEIEISLDIFSKEGQGTEILCELNTTHMEDSLLP